MDAYRNIAFGLKIPSASGDTIEQRVRKAAEMLQITDLLHRRPRELSGGQRQRVAIARAIVRQPQVFLFDEPLSNLDAVLRAKTRLEIARLHDELKATMIFVTHDQLEAMTLADRIVLLNNGRIEQTGTPTDLYRRPATRFAAQFIGSPTMNILPATINDGLATLASGERLAIPIPFTGPADIGIRAENISQVALGEAETLQARVLHIEDLGEARIVHVALRDGTSLALRHADDDASPRKGDTVALRLDPQRLHLFGRDGRRIE
jgi:ABC-type sugar transport system ATPase subunit